ncbi:MAG: hypothetical protein J2P17_28840, partial [Mycobacterium sp.]|nr:hypothetical protein [Mycobacterium sp.]
MRRNVTTRGGVHRFRRRGLVGATAAALALTAVTTTTSQPARAVPSQHARHDTVRARHAAPPAGAVVISSRGSGAVGAGRVLVDGTGTSLYDFSGDGFEALTGCQLPTNVSPGGAPCTSIWTPVLATGPVVATNGVIASGLDTEDRPGIGTQVTYFGEPLYRFVADTAPG